MLALTLGLIAHAGAAWAAPITVAVAANFRPAMQPLAEDFASRSGHQLVLVYGASGKFVAQITQGAPFAVFLSADQAMPQALEAQGLALPGTRQTYALGALLLYSSNPAMVDAAGRVLSEARFERLALANPRLAPYGQAAEQVMQSLGLVERTRDRWVYGENVTQALHFVITGNAELGFIAASLLPAAESQAAGSFWRVPPVLHAPIRQDAVLLPPGADSLVARALLAYLQTTAARAIILRHGYGVPARSGS